MTLKFRPPVTATPRNNDTHLVFIIDRSGSMTGIKQDMEGGIKQVLEDQAALPGRCFVTFAQFDTEHEILSTMAPIETIESYELLPRGGTALLDALGRTITRVKNEQLRASAPSAVIVAVVTDGEENSSREWTLPAVKSLIETQQGAGWIFYFLGANQDAIQAGTSMGFHAANSVRFDADSGHTHAVYTSTSQNMAASRMTGVATPYTDEDRAASSVTHTPSTTP